ncbi:hypothetical protein BsWGS_11778 [Bradybaena similaris]
MRGEKYYIEPSKNSSSPSAKAEAASSVRQPSESSSRLSNILGRRQHLITKLSPTNFHSSSNCSITENYKHHRLKWKLENRAARERLYEGQGYQGEARAGGGGKGGTEGGRRKRSVGVSRKHTVETLVVADSKMYQFHGGDVQQYVLTLMSVVRNIYRDSSIRNFINVVVVKLLIYENSWDQPFTVSTNAASTLKEFCLWQHRINDITPGSENHHDTAILITREDICRAPGKCDTLGLAELGTICDTIRSCSVIEDNGVSAAFTVAHELGHVFNLPHDDDKQCTDSLPEDQKNAFHVMSPTLDYNSSPWDWSNCSARLMTEFLESGLALCLQDGIRVKKWLTMMKDVEEPGHVYSVNRQCQLVFGADFSVCPYPNNPQCRRLWCTNQNDNNTGCRTKHMPWADGTACGYNRICVQGDCLPKPERKAKIVNGGWGPWKFYGSCSRTCGGGVKTKYRECINPEPQNGGRYCLGPRVRYKSCNVKPPCPDDSQDFREVQCQSEEMRKKFRFSLHNLPQNTTWMPKYTGVHMKDACKLYCSPGNSSTYYEFSKKVIDGTKCTPFTDDICVNGQCWAVGCDNRLGSPKKRDRCGVCGGDNFTCRTVAGVFNNAIYGYNYVVTIPSGATEIDVRQYGQIRHVKDDDNYLALQDSQRRYILNGEYTVRTEPWKVKVRGALVEYTGSEELTERINTTMVIEENILVFVLSVGRLNPPNITYSYMVSVNKNVQWKTHGWSKCSALCDGTRQSQIQCIGEDNVIVSRKRCKGLKQPNRVTETCNTDCKISWRSFSKEECSVRCGTGVRKQAVHCMKQTIYNSVHIINDTECQNALGPKPSDSVPCQGQCLPTSWMFTEWSQCSRTCGDGIQERQAKCVDESGKELADTECVDKDRSVTQQCNLGQCADWTTGNWLGCSVTCGTGYKQRKVWCMTDGEKVADEQCGKKKPAAKKECSLDSCPEWYIGGWGPCSVTCGTGVSLRAVKCRVSEGFQDDAVCDASMRPVDKRACFIGACPTEKSISTITVKTVPKAAFWRYGSWTECSASCGAGTKHRYVSCMDYHGNKIEEKECSHLPQPPKMENCMLQPCGDWRQGDWSDCTVTCGEGIQTRFVACTFNQQRQDDRFCDITVKPETEIRCNRATCLTADTFDVAVITSNRVVGTTHWRVGQWSMCSSSCGPGWQRRHVMCRDEKGDSDQCEKNVKPDEFKPCDNGACPTWHMDLWSNCSAARCEENGVQTRLVVCRVSDGDILGNSNCDSKNKPPETIPCKGPCHSLNIPVTWQKGPWSACSITCGKGSQTRAVICVDRNRTEVPHIYCLDKKPRNMKHCSRRPCSSKINKCPVSCEADKETNEIKCRDKNLQVVDSAACAHQNKHQTLPCFSKNCGLYRWEAGDWSECSRTCGFGHKHRSVICVDLSGERVAAPLCESDKKPKAKRRCSEFPCPYIWNTGSWSECSVTCGEGKQTRTVVCQAVTKEGWILPGEVHFGCRPEEMPSSSRYCNYGDCSSRNHWTVEPWGECSATCGHGYQRRQVNCVNKNGEITRRGLCVPLYRPVASRPCYNGHCYATSCKEFKHLTTIRRDGDYHLKVANQLVKIYCSDMRKREPREYITLPQGPGENFSETFDKKLKKSSTCPNNGQRPDDQCKECQKQTHEEAGNSTFSKIRIDLNTLIVSVSDDVFSNTHAGKFVPYATSGDCYSSSNCPQGRFSINLVDTGFIVSNKTTWNLHGNRASQRIWRLRDGQIIRGVCGGYCGVCSPDPRVGLKLDLLR